MAKIYLSLGSNLGNRHKNLRDAIDIMDKLPHISVKAVSSLYLTEPSEMKSDNWFLNCAVEIESLLSPFQLLKALQKIENGFGRKREKGKVADRTMDIDILIYENKIIESDSLKIPHPKMCGRRFALIPLCEIAPDLFHPEEKKNISYLLTKCKDSKKVTKE